MQMKTSALPRIADATMRGMSPSRFSTALTDREAHLITTATQRFAVTAADWNLHSDIAHAIERRLRFDRTTICPGLVERACSESAIPIGKEQRKAVAMCLAEPTSLLTGGPGTGKSTTLSVACRALRLLKPDIRIVVAAFSARIAEVTATRCNAEAWTLHALTGVKPGRTDRMVTRKPEIEKEIDVIVVDEAFSADPALISAVLILTGKHQKIILAGDPMQILPVGHGRVLHDVMVSDRLPTATLQETHRLKTSPHLKNQIKRVEEGRLPYAGQGLKIIEIPRQRNHGPEGEEHLKLALTLHKRHRGPAGEHAIITQMRTGPLGYMAVNRAISRRPHPGVMDRIITTAKWPSRTRDWQATRNRWHNGCCGTIENVDGDDILIVMDNGDRIVTPKNNPHIEFTHAISGHRAQGLEYGNTTLLLCCSTPSLLNRQYLVSMLSRAPNVTLITEPGILRIAVSRDALRERPPTLLACTQ